MSQSVLTNLDLNQNQIENAAIQNLSSAPENPVSGQQYFNTTDNILYYYDGTNWVKSLDLSSNKINGTPLSTRSGYFYATSDTAAATVQKVVSIPSITVLETGLMIIVQPTITSTVANSTLKLNDFDAYPMRYNDAAITTSTDSVVWNAKFPSIWVFDGTHWRFAGRGVDDNSTYSTMSVAEGTTGTATSARSMRADYLKQIIQGTVLTGLDTTSGTPIAETDTVLSGLGKLQAQVNNKADSATTLSGYGITDAYTKTEIDGMVSAGMHYKGTVASVSALPATGNKVGDLYNVTDTGANYAWSGTAWDKLSENIDLSGLAFKAEAAGSLSGSNATLTLKNVNGGTLSTVTVNNVSNATNATKATNDADGNPIKTTYLKVADAPVVNNATLTIQADGTSKGTFTANASSNATINIQKSDFYPTKTYTGLIGTSNEWKNASFYLLTVTPTNWNKEWAVKYKLEAGLDEGTTSTGYQYFTSQHECYLTGRQGVYTAYSNFNSIASTDYRVIYYHLNQRTTEAGYNAGNGHKIGIDLTSSKEQINTSYKRTIKITILDYENCTVTFNETPEIPSNSTRTDYTKLNSTYYTTSEANSAGNWSRLNGYTNGLQETGDANDNTYNQLMMSNGYLVNGSYNGSTGLYIFNYNIIGFDKDGKALCISVPSASATAASTSVNTARVYNTVGFDYNKGLMYTGQNTAYASGANMNISPRVAQSQLDLRYSDNAVASSSANTLGLVVRKPIYLRGTIGNDGLFYLAPMEVTYNSATYKRAWTQDIPTTEDGYVYWFIGFPYYNSSYPNSLYQINFYPDKQVFHFKDGKYQIYVPTGSASNSGSFTTSNWTLSNSKYNYTITLTNAQPNANVVFYDSNNQQVFPEEVKLTKSNGNITSVTAVIGADPDCRFAGTYSIFY